MGAKLFVITGTEIKETGKISFKFMFDSGAPFIIFKELASQWGLVQLGEEDPNSVNPFKLGEAMFEKNDKKRMELLEEAVAVDTLVWTINIFKSGKGLLLATSVDDDPEDEGLKKMLKEFPDCVLLMHRELFDRFEAAAKELEIEVNSHHFDGELSTS